MKLTLSPGSGSLSSKSIWIIPSPGIEEVVVLKGPARSVKKAEQMLLELQTSAREKNLSWEQRDALLAGGERCLLAQLQGRWQVPSGFLTGFQGGKLILLGKPGETKKAIEMVEEELRKIFGD